MSNKQFKINDIVEFKKIKFKIIYIFRSDPDCLLNLVDPLTDVSEIASHIYGDVYYKINMSLLSPVFKIGDQVALGIKNCNQIFEITSEVLYECSRPYYETVDCEGNTAFYYAVDLIKESQTKKTVQEFFAHWKQYVK